LGPDEKVHLVSVVPNVPEVKENGERQKD
jgi:hypothetical protein